ncbi:hypothetical protein UFOVP71_448 [uncultured Caudovirales phage]|uniref:Uncharacterized protein n=1 Tax=uncultured Caudovirales phage TaxID=2100421 RepID=A0A6J5TE16_9CAUD|nr:hypothetical protein UFOVP71_448 [uncultured Caudovirales phage]
MSMFNKAKTKSVSYSKISDIPVVFLSFDEPNADAHWELLKHVTPHNRIARVHGVVGFDTAHKTAADQFPDSAYIITVDADNQVDPKFFNKILPDGMDGKVSYTWGGRQFTNGLMYGNGGLKMWSTEHLANMRSHELAIEERDAVDFCWDFQRYKELPGCFSNVYTNSSPYQAFRVGFREGIKLSMEQGSVLSFEEWPTKMHAANFQRLLTWMTLGRDVNNGMWSVYGARLAVYLLQYENFDVVNIRDYAWFNEFFKKYEESDPVRASKSIGKKISEGLGWILPDFDTEQSSFLKMLQLHPAKSLTYDDVKWRTNLSLYGWFNE